MFRLGLVTLAIFSVAAAAQAQGLQNQEPTKCFVCRESFSEPKTLARNEHVRTQLLVQKQNYLARDRKSFSSADSVQFITPTNRPDHKVGSTKLYIGVVVKF